MVTSPLTSSRTTVRRPASTRRATRSVRYAIAYEASIADETGAYLPAVLLEFGERGYHSYSAYSFVDGVGEGDGFRWTDPAPAGELDPLI